MGSQDINAVTLVGRLTRDSELRYTASGTAKAEFSIAMNRRVKKGEEWKDEASFFDFTLWAKQAENLNKYLTKGTQVAIKGELVQERWEKDGKQNSKVKVSIETIQLLGGGKESSGSGNPAPEKVQYQSADGPVELDANQYEDDIPF